MNNGDIAVEAKDISKSFKLAHEKRMRLKDYFLRPFSKIKYTKFDALKTLSFDVKKGEFIAIVGRNGSGKSTLLKILAGVYFPDEGEIHINGKLIPFLELGVGFNTELTGRENVFLNGAILGMTNSEIKKRYNKIVEFAEIEEFMDTQLKHYSSGMMIRLAFAIAIQADGDIYLLDEVLAVGDTGFQQKCFKEFDRIIKEGNTIILVTHDIQSVKKLADRVLWINKGILKTGDKDQIIKEYEESYEPEK